MCNVYTKAMTMTAVRKAKDPSAPKVKSPRIPKVNLGTPKHQKEKTYNLRVDDATDRLINDARSMLGQSRTEFMLSTAKMRAQEVLLSRTNFVLSDAEWAAFQADLEDATPTPAMVALMSRIPAWER